MIIMHLVDNTGCKVEICMYMVDEDKIPIRQDISADIFVAFTEGVNDEGEWFVDDVDACIDYAKDWVDCTQDFVYDGDSIGDFADEDGFHVYERHDYRMAIINDEIYSNYDI